MHTTLDYIKFIILPNTSQLQDCTKEWEHV